MEQYLLDSLAVNRCKWCDEGIVYEFGNWVGITTGDHHCGEFEHEKKES